MHSPFCSWWYAGWCAPPSRRTRRQSAPAALRGWHRSQPSAYRTSVPACRHCAPELPRSTQVDGEERGGLKNLRKGCSECVQKGFLIIFLKRKQVRWLSRDGEGGVQVKKKKSLAVVALFWLFWVCAPPLVGWWKGAWLRFGWDFS